jgi:hypothetical protein
MPVPPVITSGLERVIVTVQADILEGTDVRPQPQPIKNTIRYLAWAVWLLHFGSSSCSSYAQFSNDLSTIGIERLQQTDPIPFQAKPPTVAA